MCHVSRPTITLIPSESSCDVRPPIKSSPVPSEYLAKVLDGYSEAVLSVREFATGFQDDEPDEVFEARMALGALDGGLTCPRFTALLILTYAPEIGDFLIIKESFGELEKIDAIRRATKIVTTVQESGVLAAGEDAQKLADELRAWWEATLSLPEMHPVLVAYRADPQAINRSS